MAKNRGKNEITTKQVKILSMVIAIIVSVISFIALEIIIFCYLSEKMTRVTLCTFLIPLGIVVFALTESIFYDKLFKGTKREFVETNRKIKKEIKNSLSTKTYTEVYFDFESSFGYNSKVKMLEKILENEDIKFYAKLTKGDSIILVAKDKYGDEVYESIITNLSYYAKNFKKK